MAYLTHGSQHASPHGHEEFSGFGYPILGLLSHALLGQGGVVVVHRTPDAPEFPVVPDLFVQPRGVRAWAAHERRGRAAWARQPVGVFFSPTLVGLLAQQ